MVRFRVSTRTSEIIAWLGLLLMMVSFLTLLLTPEPFSPRLVVPQHKKVEPFALVILDPGHGGQDSGAIAGGVLEKDLTLDIAQRVDRLLDAQGVMTLLTRNGDSYVSLGDRAQLINRADNAVVVSIHLNDGPRPDASGIETYFAAQQATGIPLIASWLPFLQKVTNPRPNLESQSLAQFIQQQLVARTQAVNRGTKAQQFYVLANVRHPAVLVEGGFLTGKNDIGKLADANYRELLAMGITDGILKYRDTVKALAVNVHERVHE
jgi:N-acetylmuramoyl-L-alanine amidase